MNDKLDALKPKHGKELKFDMRIEKNLEIVKRIGTLNNGCNAYFTLLILASGKYDLVIPCKQCWNDTALEFEEIASLMRELVDGK